MLKGEFPSSLDSGEESPPRILGVDPGLTSTGFGVIQFALNGSLLYDQSGIIRPRGLAVPQRIQQIYQNLTNLIHVWRPRYMAVERPFCGKNVKTAMLLGQARGAAILAAAECGVEVQEYSPLEVKQAVVGYGRAAKEQVQTMVQSILRAPRTVNPHAADALAVALCLAHSLAWQTGVKRAEKDDNRMFRRGGRE